MSTNKGKGRRKRVELCNWSKEVPVAVQSKGNHKKRKSERVHITPDTVITCNVCGNEMRVCKCLK